MIPLKNNDFWYQFSLNVLLFGGGAPVFNKFVHFMSPNGTSPGIATLTLPPASIMPPGTYHFAVGFGDPSMQFFDAASTGAAFTISK